MGVPGRLQFVFEHEDIWCIPSSFTVNSFGRWTIFYVPMNILTSLMKRVPLSLMTAAN